MLFRPGQAAPVVLFAIVPFEVVLSVFARSVVVLVVVLRPVVVLVVVAVLNSFHLTVCLVRAIHHSALVSLYQVLA